VSKSGPCCLRQGTRVLHRAGHHYLRTHAHHQLASLTMGTKAVRNAPHMPGAGRALDHGGPRVHGRSWLGLCGGMACSLVHGRHMRAKHIERELAPCAAVQSAKFLFMIEGGR